MTGMPGVTALPPADGMRSVVIFMIVDVEDAGSGSVPRALVMVRDELLCFLDLCLKAVVGGGGNENKTVMWQQQLYHHMSDWSYYKSHICKLLCLQIS